MSRVADIAFAIEQIAPKRYAFPFDSVGLQVGDPSAQVTGIVFSLDRSLGAIEECQRLGASLLIAHHPLLFQPTSSVVANQDPGGRVHALALAGIAFIAAHTNWDSAKGGINDALAARLGLLDVKDFGTAAPVKQFRLVLHGPGPQLDSWNDIGPQMTVREDQLLTLRSLLAGVQYDLTPLVDSFEQPAGRVGHLPSRMRLDAFQAYVDEALDTRATTWGAPGKIIRTVAVCGGAADGEYAFSSADVFLTGEVKQHIALAAVEQQGTAIVAAGHYATEQPGVEELRLRISAMFPEIPCHLYTPEKGSFGRPI